jgi:chromate transporter
MDPLTYFWLLLKATALSTGGYGGLPSLHEDFVSRHIASDADFDAALAVGAITPGPSGLWIVSIGFLTAGWWGASLAAVAAIAPPLLILPIESIHRRYGDLPAAGDFVRGLSLAVVAVVPIVLLRLISSYGLDSRSLIILACSSALALSRRVPQLAVICLAALAGIALYS